MSDLTQGSFGIQSFFRATLELNSRQTAQREELKHFDKDASPLHTTKTFSRNDNDIDEAPEPHGLTHGALKDVPKKSLSQKTMIEMQEVDLSHARRKRCKTDSTNLEPSGSSVETTAESQRSEALNGLFTQHQDRISAGGQGLLVDHPDTGCILQPEGTQSGHLKPSSTTTRTSAGLLTGPSLGAECMHVINSSRTGTESKSAPVEPSKIGKVLKLNFETGTIGSPPRRKPGKIKSEEKAVDTPRRRRGRHRKAIVTIKYGTDSRSRRVIGEKIEALTPQKPQQSIPNTITDKAAGIPSLDPGLGLLKSTHPFFLGKASSKVLGNDRGASAACEHTEQKSNTSLPIRETFAKTGPGKPIRAALPLAAPVVMPHHSGYATRMTIIPGAADPPWPPKNMVHVRGCAGDILQNVRAPRTDNSDNRQKHKHSAGDVVAAEDVLTCRFQSLHVVELKHELMSVDTEEFPAPAPCLRLPTKHFLSGNWLQRRLDHELDVAPPISECMETDADELSGPTILSNSIHPAIQKTYGLLSISSSAFDRSQRETSLWSDKYAPNNAGEVLQNGQESIVLKNWLKALTVKAVETSLDEVRNRGISTASRKSTATMSKLSKRKRKPKLEGFIVSSDEEGDEMDDILPCDRASPHGSQEYGRSVVRTENLSKIGRVTNAIAISGPNGCGKTAMVYAAAKELGFEVFEINASSRRSGKDVLERVGDMTKNHLVYTGTDQGAISPGNAPSKLTAVPLEDTANGHQSNLNAFFSSRGSAMKGKGNKRGSGAKEVAKTSSPPKAQKQSLILLEEVDVLYAEDKQFWSTVMDLIVQSRRPVVMTCNDESIVPLQTLDLYAILRLNHPPTELATSYMLLVAANEGHIIKRAAVENLYKSRNFDLRGSLHELQFWCQIGIGDRKGGMEWFYPRWPPGSDLDEHGNMIRTISEDTYRTGMGLLSHDLLHSAQFDQIRSEAIKIMWREAQLDMDSDKCCTVPLPVTTGAYTGTVQEGRYDDFTTKRSRELFEAMSAADLCASGQLNQGRRVALDTTSPKLSLKARDDYVVGYELLQADEMVHYDMLATDISVWLRANSCHLLSETFEGNGVKEDVDARLIHSMSRRYADAQNHLTRKDLSLAFDPISTPEHVYPQLTASLDCSVFDRPIKLITTEVAPYVRSIVASDIQLQAERAKLNSLLNDGGRSGKRMRTTRAALSALEGGARTSTRKDKYFDAPLDYAAVRRTGATSWVDAVKHEMAKAVEDAEVEGAPSVTALDEASMPQACSHGHQ